MLCTTLYSISLDLCASTTTDTTDCNCSDEESPNSGRETTWDASKEEASEALVEARKDTAKKAREISIISNSEAVCNFLFFFF